MILCAGASAGVLPFAARRARLHAYNPCLRAPVLLLPRPRAARGVYVALRLPAVQRMCRSTGLLHDHPPPVPRQYQCICCGYWFDAALRQATGESVVENFSAGILEPHRLVEIVDQVEGLYKSDTHLARVEHARRVAWMGKRLGVVTFCPSVLRVTGQSAATRLLR